MSNGWVKLHRNLSEWQWINSPNHLAVFITLLLRANYKDTKWRKITVKSGSLITGRKQLSLWSGVSESSVRRILLDFESTQEVTIKKTNKFSIISITNWCKYQENDNVSPTNEPTSEPTNEQQMNNKRPTNEQQMTTSKKERKKEVKKERNIYIPTSEIFDLWNEFVDKNNGLLSKAVTLSDKRKAQIKSCWHSYEEMQNIEAWKNYFEKVFQSDFLTGSNEKGWRADFDWITNKNNLLKVVEGRYDSTGSKYNANISQIKTEVNPYAQR